MTFDSDIFQIDSQKLFIFDDFLICQMFCINLSYAYRQVWYHGDQLKIAKKKEQAIEEINTN